MTPAGGEPAAEETVDEQGEEVHEPFRQARGRILADPICIGGIGVGRCGRLVGHHGGRRTLPFVVGCRQRYHGNCRQNGTVGINHGLRYSCRRRGSGSTHVPLRSFMVWRFRRKMSLR